MPVLVRVVSVRRPLGMRGVRADAVAALAIAGERLACPVAALAISDQQLGRDAVAAAVAVFVGRLPVAALAIAIEQLGQDAAAAVAVPVLLRHVLRI